MKKQGEGSDALRKKAEQRAAERRAREGTAAGLSVADAAALVHELQVHQIELEMQNEELQQARTEAELARARLADLFDFAPVGYFTVAPDSAIREVNLTGARTLGVDRAGLVTRRLAGFLAEADRPAFSAAMARAVETGTTQECGATLAPGTGEGRRSTFLQLTIAASSGGEELRVAVVDATERRRAEEQARTSQKLEAIGQLAGGVAHDFNNLLTIILSSCELALDDVGVEAPSHEPLVELKGAAERAADLTRRLLAFSRKQVVLPRVVDLNALVRDAAATLRPLLRADIDVVLSLAPDLGPVELDPAQLDQVLAHLAVNARDAMPDGGTLTIATANVEPPAGERPAGAGGGLGPRVRLTVRDTGTGIDAATLEHVFEPFFTTKATGQGTGLGLAIVFGVVKGCGGVISVRSAPGAGATFDLDFPRAREPLARELPPKRRAPAIEGTETILVVEDEPVVLRIAVRVLKAAGYAVLGATNGAEALAMCEQHDGIIDLVVSDIVMPGMSGIALGQRLRTTSPKTKVLYMSGYTADALAPEQGVRVTAAELLGKPFTPEELRVKVRQMLDEGR
jgi:signal transduction histidine kinase/ActR/RegA family two-component response regulator